MLQSLKVSDDSRMNELSESLREHSAISQELGHFFQNYRFPAAPESDQIAALRAELKAEIAQSQRHTPQNLSLQTTQTPTGQDDRILNSIAAQSRNNLQLKSDINDLSQWKLDLEKGIEKLPSSAMPAEFETTQRVAKSAQRQWQEAKARLDKIESQSQGRNPGSGDIESRLLQLEAARNQFQGVEPHVENISNHFESRLKQHDADIGAQRIKLDQIQKRLDERQQGSTNATPSTNNMPHTDTRIEERVASSEKDIAELKSYNTAMKPTNECLRAMAAGFPTLEKTIGAFQANPVLQKGPDWFTSVDKCIQSTESLAAGLRGLGPSVHAFRENPVLQKGPEWIASVDRCIQSNEPLVISLRSLETRYNNLSSENLVKQMVHAMHEMYPSLPVLIEQVEALKQGKEAFAKQMESLNTSISDLKSTPTPSKEHIEQLKKELEELKLQTAAHINGLQTAQRDESNRLTKNIEVTNELRCDSATHATCLTQLGSQGDDNSKKADELETKLTGFVSQFEKQYKLFLEEVQPRLEELKALGTAEEIQSDRKQLQEIKSEGIVNKMGKMEDSLHDLNEKVESYRQELEKSLASAAEARPEPLRLETSGPGAERQPPNGASPPSPRKTTEGNVQDLPLSDRISAASPSRPRSSAPPTPMEIPRGKRKRSVPPVSENSKFSSPRPSHTSQTPSESDFSSRKKKKSSKKERRRQSQLQQ